MGESRCEKDAREPCRSADVTTAREPPELNLTPKQNQLRTGLEMWVMDELPALFGVDDSEELDEKHQEDAQADQITFLIAETDEAQQDVLVGNWLEAATDK